MDRRLPGRFDQPWAWQVVKERNSPQVMVEPSQVQLLPVPERMQRLQLQDWADGGWAKVVRAVKERTRPRPAMRTSLSGFMVVSFMVDA